MILSIDMISDVPIYTQLCHQIIKSIAMKELKTGDDLPSVRSLASDIGVNLHTINKAYNHLKSEGFLVVNRRKGVTVNQPEAYKSNPIYLEGLKSELEILLSEAIARGLEVEEFKSIVESINDKVKGES
jgi:DNA-binding transcriptional regulator YhcF (GntR family)